MFEHLEASHEFFFSPHIPVHGEIPGISATVQSEEDRVRRCGCLV